ncbi:MAG: hypothetical protein ABEJ65_06845, partial [bacterium]
VLAAGTVLAGYFGWTHYVGGHSEHHASHTVVIVSSWIASLGGAIGAYLVYQLGIIKSELLYRVTKGVHTMASNQFYINEIYDRIIVKPLRGTAEFLWKWIDDLVIDGLGVNLSATSVNIFSVALRFFQTGYIRHYLVATGGFLVGLITILGLYLFLGGV